MKKFYDEVNFYQSMELFSSWAAITMKYLVYHTEKRSYIRGQRVYRQQDHPDGFYIIREGEFQMLSKVPVQTQVSASSLKGINYRKIDVFSLFFEK